MRHSRPTSSSGAINVSRPNTSGLSTSDAAAGVGQARPGPDLGASAQRGMSSCLNSLGELRVDRESSGTGLDAKPATFGSKPDTFGVLLLPPPVTTCHIPCAASLTLLSLMIYVHTMSMYAQRADT